MSDAIARIRRHFGGQLSEDVLSEVLEIVGGDANAAIAFLAGDAGDAGPA